MQNKNYFIREGYIHRDKYYHYDDTGLKDEYQHHIYEKALDIAATNMYKKILDIGCGSGYKLVTLFDGYDITGLDIEPTLSWLKKTYPNHKWYESNFNKNELEDFYDVIICADVIEHLVEPDELIAFIKSIKFNYLILSTPERDMVQMYQRGHLWDGPPANPAHVREWNYEEFNNYIAKNFTIEEHVVVKNNAEPTPMCQMVVCRKNNV